jgi:hypothetical protein
MVCVGRAWAAHGPRQKREHAEMRVRTVGKQKCNAHSVATHAHAGWPKATYSRKITDSTADVGAHTSGRSQSQHVTSTHECQIDIVQQNQLPIHVRTTLRRERKKRVKGLFLELRLVIYRVDLVTCQLLSHTEPLVIPTSPPVYKTEFQTNKKISTN